MKSDFFGGLGSRTDNNDIFSLRRKDLVSAVQKMHNPDNASIIMLFAGLEDNHEKFQQDKTFFYYTGLDEAGLVMTIDMHNKTTLYIPHCFEQRKQWMNVKQAFLSMNEKALGVDEVMFLGSECADYSFSYYFSSEEYKNIFSLLHKVQTLGGKVFTTLKKQGNGFNVSVQHCIDQIKNVIPWFRQGAIDVSDIIAQSRCRKDMGEIEKIYRAIEITELAHESAVQAIKNGVSESEIQASLEYMMIASQARPAFSSIVASGANATILHHRENKGTVKNGDLVVIDIGAEFNHYCADITRTYPVAGIFTKRQKELYKVVLETQQYIADLAKPGMWLKNKEKADKSLHHLALNYLAKRGGYDKYFPHSIGHYLGLDVHDVGSYAEPLEEGCVITIEPGIYIPSEGIGIRIEDNYWITKEGAMCLSDGLPKSPEDIEAFVQSGLEDDADEQDDEYYDEDEDDDLN